MIGIDANILARFYCEDPDDPEAIRQRPIARRIMVELLGMAHVVVEHWEAVSDAIELHRQGLEFADALHWTGSEHACPKSCSLSKRTNDGDRFNSAHDRSLNERHNAVADLRHRDRVLHAFPDVT
jgi:predicted nucleic-acid-binding protein